MELFGNSDMFILFQIQTGFFTPTKILLSIVTRNYDTSSKLYHFQCINDVDFYLDHCASQHDAERRVMPSYSQCHFSSH